MWAWMACVECMHHGMLSKRIYIVRKRYILYEDPNIIDKLGYLYGTRVDCWEGHVASIFKIEAKPPPKPT